MPGAACDRMKGPSLRARRPNVREMPGRCGLRLAAEPHRPLSCSRFITALRLRTGTVADSLLLAFSFQLNEQFLEVLPLAQAVEIFVRRHVGGVPVAGSDS